MSEDNEQKGQLQEQQNLDEQNVIDTNSVSSTTEVQSKKQRNKLTIILTTIIIILFCILAFMLLKKDTPTTAPSYPPVTEDPNSEELEESSVPALDKPESGGAITITASSKVNAKKGNGVAEMMYQNPSQSREGIVLQLHITDEELIRTIRKTGRTEPSKREIEKAEDYDPKTSRVIIAESGLIKPGKALNKLQLKTLPDGTVLPKGEYNAIFYILPYDLKTNERAILSTQLPVKLVIEE